MNDRLQWQFIQVNGINTRKEIEDNMPDILHNWQFLQHAYNIKFIQYVILWA